MLCGRWLLRWGIKLRDNDYLVVDGASIEAGESPEMLEYQAGQAILYRWSHNTQWANDVASVARTVLPITGHAVWTVFYGAPPAFTQCYMYALLPRVTPCVFYSLAWHGKRIEARAARRRFGFASVTVR